MKQQKHTAVQASLHYKEKLFDFMISFQIEMRGENSESAYLSQGRVVFKL